MQQYLKLCQDVLVNGIRKEDRTGTGTISIFGRQYRYDLQDGFPLITTKDMSGVRFEGIVRELLWFLKGGTNIKTLTRNGINIWNKDAYKAYTENVNHPMSYEAFVRQIKESDDFADKYGELGPVYGKQWTDWETPGDAFNINQIDNVIKSIKRNPDSRRHIVSAWNPSDIQTMTLPPCHVLFQFYVADGKLSCQLYQRSGDIFLGVPYNIASYALLTYLVAQVTGYEAGEFIHTLGDAHIYTNHIEQIKTQIKREPCAKPHLGLRSDMLHIRDIKPGDIRLLNYQAHPAIKGKQSV